MIRRFEIEVSEGTLRVVRKALAAVRVVDERFSTEELLCIKDCIVIFDKHLGDEDDCNS